MSSFNLYLLCFIVPLISGLAVQAWLRKTIAVVIFQFTGLIAVALIVFGFAVVFQFVTLPVEFNASRRAAVQLKELRLVNHAEAAGVRQTLTAAAMTYVAGALASVAQLLYFLTIFGGGRD